MTVYKTDELIQQLQQQTEDFLQQAINKWQVMPTKILLQQPQPGKWSAAQCLEHLNTYGLYYLPAIEKAIDLAKRRSLLSQDEFKPGWLGNYFTNLMKPDTDGKKMKKMKAPKKHSPVPELDAQKVVTEFINQQEKLLLLLRKAAKIDLQKAKVSISIARFIRLQLGDTFMFLIMHNYRHVIQTQKALMAARPGLKDEHS